MPIEILMLQASRLRSPILHRKSDVWQMDAHTIWKLPHKDKGYKVLWFFYVFFMFNSGTGKCRSFNFGGWLTVMCGQILDALEARMWPEVRHCASWLLHQVFEWMIEKLIDLENKELYLIFIDYSKAFDKVDHSRKAVWYYVGHGHTETFNGIGSRTV